MLLQVTELEKAEAAATEALERARQEVLTRERAVSAAQRALAERRQELLDVEERERVEVVRRSALGCGSKLCSKGLQIPGSARAPGWAT